MTKMAATPIYGKKPFKSLLLKNQKANDLGTWYVALGCVAYQVCLNVDSKGLLTHRRKGPNVIMRILTNRT